MNGFQAKEQPVCHRRLKQQVVAINNLPYPTYVAGVMDCLGAPAAARTAGEERDELNGGSLVPCSGPKNTFVQPTAASMRECLQDGARRQSSSLILVREENFKHIYFKRIYTYTHIHWNAYILTSTHIYLHVYIIESSQILNEP